MCKMRQRIAVMDIQLGDETGDEVDEIARGANELGVDGFRRKRRTPM